VLLGWSNTYDAFGKRIIKTPPTGGPTYFSYDRSANMLEEEQSGSLFTDYIYLNGKLIGLEESTGSGAALYYVGIDSLGTPRFVTDSSNSIVWASYFFPFGYEDGIGGSITQSVRFPGQYGDDDLEGYLYNLNRNYFASWGRYFEPDPIGLAGGLNPYVYVESNPASGIDPTGLVKVYGAGQTSVHANPGPDATTNRPEHDPPHVHLGQNDGPRVDTDTFQPLTEKDARNITKEQMAFCKALTDEERALIRANQRSVFNTGRILPALSGIDLLLSILSGQDPLDIPPAYQPLYEHFTQPNKVY
jgi:RHS repeat-associated protein